MLGYIPSILDSLAQIISIQYQHMNLQLKLQILLQVSLHYLKVSNWQVGLWLYLTEKAVWHNLNSQLYLDAHLRLDPEGT